MTIEEAVKEWVRDFSLIPTRVIQKLYRDKPEELELLSGGFPELDWPAGWGTLFAPNDPTDRRWIQEHIDEVEECGFIVYSCDEFEILLGIDGCGYSFYPAHWEPLYKKRGLQWHKSKTCAPG